MIKSTRALILAGLFSAVTTAPATAVWEPVLSFSLDRSGKLGEVDVSGEMPAFVQGLVFRATGADVMCRDVTAYFRSGDSYTLWRGFLSAGSEKLIWMMPIHRDLARIGVNCWGITGPGSVSVAATDMTGSVIATDRPVAAYVPAPRL